MNNGDTIDTHTTLNQQAHRHFWRRWCRLDGGGQRVRSPGAMVFLSGRTLGAVEQVTQEIHQGGGVAYAAQVDALDEQAVNAYLDRVVQEGESIDILLNVMGPQPRDFDNGGNTLVPSQFITARAALRGHPVCHRGPR